jgi:large subunit ribosomal protein L25
MKSITIEGQARKSTGKKDTRTLRKSGHVTCNLYGGSENVDFSAPSPSFKELVYTPEFYTANLKVDGKEIKAIMQHIQFDPVTDELMHIDFMELHPDKKVTLELPVKLEGVPAGTKEGGKINQRMKKLKVRLLPKDLIEHITIKIDHLELGDSVRIRELKMDGIEFLNAPHIPVVSVLIPRAVKEEVPATTAATAATATTATAATPAAGTTPAPEKGAAKPEEKKKEDKKK